MKLVIFGANGPTGRQVARQALALGHHVTAVTRKPDQYPLSSPLLTILAADVTDKDAVRRAVIGNDAVLSTFGVPYSRQDISVYSQGITNIIDAMALEGISRLVCVSSTAVATQEVARETLFWRKILVPFFRNVLGKTLYDDMARMEGIVQKSPLQWTIIRPAALFDTDEPTGDYEVGVERIFGRFTSRADLAQTLISEAVSVEHPRAIIEVITHAGRPSSFAVLKKTFGRKREG